jgi:cell division septum initiation protein DivIVA
MLARFFSSANVSSDARRVSKTVAANRDSPRSSVINPTIEQRARPSWVFRNLGGVAKHRTSAGLSSEGRSLDPRIQIQMEQRFGEDFSNVRIHTDQSAVQSTNEVYAKAYTIGQDIVFDKDRFAPNTPEGLGLLAHELTHVVQQQRGSSIHPSSNDSALEQEAEKVATAVLGGAPLIRVSCGTGVTISRQPDLDKETSARTTLAAEAGRLSKEIHQVKDVAIDLLESEGITIRKQLRPRRAASASSDQVLRELDRVAESPMSSASQARTLAQQLRELQGEVQQVEAQLRGLKQSSYSKPGSDTKESAPTEQPSAAPKATELTRRENIKPQSEQSPETTSATDGGFETSVPESSELAEHGAIVGGRLFAMVSIAGVLYAISDIHSFSDAVKVSESLGLSFGVGSAAKAIAASAEIGMVVPMLLGMSSDQGPGVEERWRKSAAVEAFLAKNFSVEQIEKTPDLRRQAEKLLFETNPLQIDEVDGPGMGMGSRSGAE